MRLRSLLWAIALLALASLPAKADLITVSFSGFLHGDLRPNEVLNGTYVYDSTEPGFPYFEYTRYNAVRSFAFSAGARFFSGNTGFMVVGNQVIANQPFPEDIYSVTLLAPVGESLLGLGLGLLSPVTTGSIDPVPRNEPLIRPELSNFVASGGFGQALFGFSSGRTTTFTVVPEPSTWLMLSMGLSLVGIAARRRVARNSG